MLDPDIVLREDAGTQGPTPSLVVRGAWRVAERAPSFAHLSLSARPALVNGAAGFSPIPNASANASSPVSYEHPQPSYAARV
jgi:hypothetical protein